MGHFGEANGVASAADLRAAIARYRRAPLLAGEDPEIGCILLRDVTFTESPIEAPRDFAANVVTGKTYDLAQTSSSYIETALRILLSTPSAPSQVPGDVFGKPRLVTQRLGRQAFLEWHMDVVIRAS